MKLNNCKDEIIDLWQSGEHTLQSIANKYSVSRTAVKYCLNKHGYDTPKKVRSSEFICDLCSIKFIMPNSRRLLHKHKYCSSTCYYKSLHNPDYRQNRQGQRVARKNVENVFPLKSDHIVHHVDGNCLNNKLNNLMVFESQSDHLKFHRGENIKSLFSGEKY